jgi:ABC-type transport system substrate-binding protein
LPYPDWLANTVYQTLVDANLSALYPGGNGQSTIQFLPGLAKGWTVSADGRSYTFDLRQGIRFSNGDPFNSYQIWAQMYGFYYLSANSSTWLESYPIFDMSPVNFGPSTITLLNQSGLTSPSSAALKLMSDSTWPIYANGPDQIVFRLKSPFQWFPGTLIEYDGLLFDTQFVLRHGGFGTPSTYNTYFNQKPIPGTGPYMVVGIGENSFVKFTQNPNYWGNNLTAAQIAADRILDPGHAKDVIIYNKPDDVSRYIDLSNGVVQIASIKASDWRLVLAHPELYSYLTLPPSAGLVTSIGLNTQLYPTNITAVRQAIVHAINYTEISQKIFFGQTASYVGPEYPGWRDYYNLGNLQPYKYNLTLAKQYLAQANITNMPPLTYYAISGCALCVGIGEIIQSDLGQIGVMVNEVVISPSVYYSTVGISYAGELADPGAVGHMAIVGGFQWSPNELTPADFWVTYASNRSISGNGGVYYNPIVQKAIDSFFTGENATYVRSLLTQAQVRIYNDAPYVWVGINTLWELDGSVVWNKNVISGMYGDPTFSGQTPDPIFNTVTLA